MRKAMGSLLPMGILHKTTLMSAATKEDLITNTPAQQYIVNLLLTFLLGLKLLWEAACTLNLQA